MLKRVGHVDQRWSTWQAHGLDQNTGGRGRGPFFTGINSLALDHSSTTRFRVEKYSYPFGGPVPCAGDGGRTDLGFENRFSR